jgi:hypothetical protein
MLRVDDKQKEVQAVEIKACKRISMHIDRGPCLNLSLIHTIYINSFGLLVCDVQVHPQLSLNRHPMDGWCAGGC